MTYLHLQDMAILWQSYLQHLQVRIYALLGSASIGFTEDLGFSPAYMSIQAYGVSRQITTAKLPGTNAVTVKTLGSFVVP